MTYRPLIYWLPQILLSAMLAVIGVAGGWFVRGTELDTDNRGTMMLVVGLVFVALTGWLVVRMVLTLRRQQAQYDWAAAQQRSVAGADESVVREIAERARRGELSRAEVEALQAHQPDLPYPGVLPKA